MGNGVVVQVVLPLALFFIMLGVGMALRLSDFKTLLKQPKAVLLGVTAQLLLLPALGFFVVSLFALPPLLAIGVMILTFAPGGATSNLISFLCRGDTALSVCLTAVAGVITPFTMPVLTLLALEYWLGEGQMIDFPVAGTMIKLLAIGVLPVAIGVIIHHRWPDFCLKVKKTIKVLATSFLVIVVLGIIKANWDQLPEQILQVGPAVLSLVMVAMVLGAIVAKSASLSVDQQVTFAIEVGIQNAATALLVTGGILNNPEMSASALIYGVLMNIPIFGLIVYRNFYTSSAQRAT